MADSTYQPGVYRKQGGTEFVVASGAKLTLETGSLLSDRGAYVPSTIGFTPAAGGSNVSEITLQVKDGAGNALAGVFVFDLWLSDAATGAGLTATTASGTVGAKTSSGADLGTLTSKKALRVQTLATGAYILSITDTAKTGFYVCAQTPGSALVNVSAQLVTGNYG